MNSIASRLNSVGMYLDTTCLDEKKRGCLVRKGNAGRKLLDLGFISDPSDVSVYEIRECLLSEYPDWVTSYFTLQNSGLVAITPDTINYAICKIESNMGTKDKEDEDYCIYKEALLAYKDYLEADDDYKALLSIEERISSMIASKKGKSTLLFLKPHYTTLNGRLKTLRGSVLDKTALLSCMHRDDNSKLIRIDTREVLIKSILKLVGLSDSSVADWRKSGKAFFLDGLTAEQELNFIPYILSGAFRLDGKFGKCLLDFIDRNVEDSLVVTFDRAYSALTFEDMVFLNASEERSELLKGMQGVLDSVDGRAFYLDASFLYWQVPNSAIEGFRVPALDKNGYGCNYTVLPDESSKTGCIVDDELIIGAYAFSHDRRRSFSKVNQLLGISGEFISKKKVDENNWYSTVPPVEIYTTVDRGNSTAELITELCYPVSDVYYSDSRLDTGEINAVKLRSLVDVEYKLVFSELTDVLDKVGCSSVDTLFDRMRVVVDEVLGLEDKRLSEVIADLTCGLLLCECGKFRYKLKSSITKTLSPSEFLQASCYAEIVYKTFDLKSF